MKKFLNARVSASFNQGADINEVFWSATIGFLATDRNVLAVRLPSIKGLRPRGKTVTFSADAQGLANLLDALRDHDAKAKRAASFRQVVKKQPKLIHSMEKLVNKDGSLNVEELLKRNH